jgi:hypothetical protein
MELPFFTQNAERETLNAPALSLQHKDNVLHSAFCVKPGAFSVLHSAFY